MRPCLTSEPRASRDKAFLREFRKKTSWVGDESDVEWFLLRGALARTLPITSPLAPSIATMHYMTGFEIPGKGDDLAG